MRLTVTMALLAALMPGCGGGSLEQPSRPNIVLVMTDDQGYGDLGIHGNPHVKTPNIDAFAREGVQFERFYVSPVCAPTRASLMTGRYYYRGGVIHTSRGGAKMHGGETTIAEMLRPAGYRTGIFGKWHLGDTYPMRPQDQGFEESLIHKSGGIAQAPDIPNDYFDPWLWKNGELVEESGYCTDIFFNEALRFIERRRAEPFFVYLPTNAPHAPLIVDDDYAAPYREMGLDDTTAKVYGMVRNIDENFGRLLAKLDELGLRDDTVVIFMTDNGPQQARFNAGLRGRKSSTYEGGIRVPSFWQWQGKLKAPSKIGPIAAHIDVAPTLLELAGVSAPKGLAFDGRSLVPLLRGEDAAWPERTLFFQCHRGLTPRLYQNAAVQTDKYKLVLGPGSFNDENWKAVEPPPVELYDLTGDPGEQRNLAAEQPEMAADLQKRYEAWFDDVKSTRQFTPGVIHLGSDREPVTILCRYQDAAWADGKPTTWTVEIERAGQYELTVDRGKDSGPAEMYLSLNGEVSSKPANRGNRAVFELPAGPAKIDVWVQPKGGRRALITDNSAVGDVAVRRMPSSTE